MSTSAPADHTYRYVILGAGNAAGYAARRFVEAGLDPQALCLVGDEPHLPYERPALSKAFLTNPAVRLPGFHVCVGSGGARQPPEWYVEHGIATLTSSRAVALDAPAKRVTLADGRVVAASDALILATGADPIRLTRTPGHDLTGIHYLRNNADGLALFDALQAARGKTVAVIGGGYIGMEVTAAAVTVGCNVKMIFPEPHIMPRLFTPQIAAPYEQLYKDKGVEILNDGRLGKEFLAGDDGAVRAVRVARDGHDDEEVAADLVVVGVGALPATAIFKGQVDLDERGGVVVNSSLQTSAPGVYAIGDIATFPLKLYGDRPARMEHVQNCRDMAAHAVDAILKPADKTPYDYLPYFYSRVFHMSWQFFGDNAGECAVVSELDAAVLKDWSGDGQHPQLVAIWTVDGALQGIFMESPSAEDTGNMKKLARDRPSVDVAAFSASKTVADAWKVLLA